jgi:hypothetical protein
VTAGAKASSGSSLVLDGIAYCPVDPDLEFRALVAGETRNTGLGEDLFSDYLYRYLDMVGARFDAPELGSAFRDVFQGYLGPVAADFDVEPRYAAISEEETVEFALRMHFDEPGRTLLALGAFDRPSGTLLSVSSMVAVSFDGESSRIEF